MRRFPGMEIVFYQLDSGGKNGRMYTLSNGLEKTDEKASKFAKGFEWYSAR